MPHIPQATLDRQTSFRGLDRLNIRHRGKVRDSYELEDPTKMLVVASDRCSIFDFVLNGLIPDKGAVLTAMNVWWDGYLSSHPGIKTDLVAYGSAIDEYLPPQARNNPELQKHAQIVNIVPAPDVEDIVRLHLTGSGWESYKKDGTVCGHKLPAGLSDGSRLLHPIYTPTTKAQVGHDEHITAASVVVRFGPEREKLAIRAAEALANMARAHNIILADTKFEFSQLSDGTWILADEKGTPDSSRFWDLGAWSEAQAKSKLPPSFDKQFVREWGKLAGIEKDPSGRKRDPQNREDLEYAAAQSISAEIVTKTTRIYRHIFWRLTQKKIESFQKHAMDINVPQRKPFVEILVGSESDKSQIHAGLDELFKAANVQLHFISCHRNPSDLRNLVKSRLVEADVVIAGAGMAAALPGVVKALLCEENRFDIPVIGVAFKGKDEAADQAARLSIEQLPGRPVELDRDGKAYFGPEGFRRACIAALQDEFMPREYGQKPAQINVPLT